MILQTRYSDISLKGMFNENKNYPKWELYQKSKMTVFKPQEILRIN